MRFQIPLACMLIFVTGAVATAQSKDIVDTAVAAGSFKTLVTAVQAAGLVDALKGEGPFTVFAPTDEAFNPPTGPPKAHRTGNGWLRSGTRTRDSLLPASHHPLPRLRAGADSA